MTMTRRTSESRLAVVTLLCAGLLSTACGRGKPNPALVGTWDSAIDTLTLNADGTFSRTQTTEVGKLTSPGPATGKWGEREQMLRLDSDQAWARGEYRWEIKALPSDRIELDLVPSTQTNTPVGSLASRTLIYFKRNAGFHIIPPLPSPQR